MNIVLLRMCKPVVDAYESVADFLKVFRPMSCFCFITCIPGATMNVNYGLAIFSVTARKIYIKTLTGVESVGYILK